MTVSPHPAPTGRAPSSPFVANLGPAALFTSPAAGHFFAAWAQGANCLMESWIGVIFALPFVCCASVASPRPQNWDDMP